MPLIHTEPNSFERNDPFFTGYEKLRRSTKTSLVQEVTAHTNSSVLQATRLRIVGISSFYYPNTNETYGNSYRSANLKHGMLIGLYAGAFSMPRFARNRYYEYMINHLDFEGPVFGGYHADITTIEDAVAPPYRNLGEKIEITVETKDYLKEILEIGMGWMATTLAEYHETHIGGRIGQIMPFHRNTERRMIIEDCKFLSKPGEFTVADLGF